MYDLIIIGGGGAALAAAAYALEKNLNILVIWVGLGGKSFQDFSVGATDNSLSESMRDSWSYGQHPYAGTTHAAGEACVQNFAQRILQQPGACLNDSVVRVEQLGQFFQIKTQSNSLQQARAVIVATGVTPRMLSVPGAATFLDNGLSYSATTHAYLLAGRRVAIIGTTMRSVRGATELTQRADRIYFIQPEPIGAAEPMIYALRQHPTVEVLEDYRVVAIQGHSRVEQIVIEQGQNERVLDIDAIFVDLGIQPNSHAVQHLVQTDRKGFIWINERNATTHPGIFAAGDVTSSFAEQILIAIGDGVRAAVSAYEYLLAQPIERLRAVTV